MPIFQVGVEAYSELRYRDRVKQAGQNEHEGFIVSGPSVAIQTVERSRFIEALCLPRTLGTTGRVMIKIGTSMHSLLGE